MSGLSRSAAACSAAGSATARKASSLGRGDGAKQGLRVRRPRFAGKALRRLLRRDPPARRKARAGRGFGPTGAARRPSGAEGPLWVDLTRSPRGRGTSALCASRPFVGPIVKARFGSNSPVRQAVGGCPVIARSRRPESVESRCGAVAVGRAYLFAAPFVWRCLSGSTVAPFPHPAHR